MAQRRRSNLPEERRMVVVGLVEALKLGARGSFTSRREATGTCDRGSVSQSRRATASRTKSVAAESSKGPVGGANGQDGRRGWLTWGFGRRLMRAGGRWGGLGCKEEKFAASKMVLCRRPQSQSTQLLVRRMGAEARRQPVPAFGAHLLHSQPRQKELHRTHTTHSFWSTLLLLFVADMRHLQFIVDW